MESETFAPLEDPVNPYSNLDLMLFKEETTDMFINIFKSVNFFYNLFFRWKKAKEL